MMWDHENQGVILDLYLLNYIKLSIIPIIIFIFNWECENEQEKNKCRDKFYFMIL